MGWLGVGLALASCAFDDDARFVPRPRAAYFLTAGETGTTTLVRCDEKGTPTFESAVDFDLDVTEKSSILWILHRDKILWRDLDSEKSGERDFTAFEAKGICTGKAWHVVWGEKKLCFIQNRSSNPKIAVVEADFTPRMALYNNEKFYFVGDSLITVWHETAFAEILRLATRFRPEHADFDELYNLLVIGPGGDGRYYSTKISATANVALYSNAPSNMRTLWYSRIWKSRYGGEAVLQTAGIGVDGGAVPDVGRPVDEIFFDFRHARGYYRSSDSLWAYEFSPDFATRKLLYGTAWTGKVLKARFDTSSGK